MLDALFADVFDGAEAAASSHELRLPFCTVRLLSAESPAVDRLNSHFQIVRTDGPVNDVIRLVLVKRSVDETEWTAALDDSPCLFNPFTGRGSFPVRWWPPAKRRRVWAAEYCGTGHRILRVENDICFLMNREGPEPLRYVQRVLREILIHAGRRGNFLMIHAAAVALRGEGGLIILGHQGAGKTDIALRICRLSHASIVAVDRVLLGLDSRARFSAIGLPFGLNIAQQSWLAIGAQLEAAKAVGRYQQEKVYVDHQDFTRLSGISIRAGTVVTAAAILSAAKNARVGPEELVRSIEAHCLYGVDPGYLHDWIGIAGDPSTLEPQERILEGWPVRKLAGASVALRHRPGDALPRLLQELLR